MIKLNPHLTFNGNCRDAMNFYKQCFGGELFLQTFAESPVAENFPEDMQEDIIHARLSNGDFVLMGTDLRGPEGFNPGNDIALTLNFDDEKDIRKYYGALSDGGKVIDDLEVKFWGDLYAVVEDRFGKTWMMNCHTKED